MPAPVPRSVLPAYASPYTAPSWLPGGHAQTIYPLLLKRPPPPLVRETWATPDGDFIDLDRLPSGDSHQPLVLLFHGLEGSARSHYAVALMQAVAALGWRGAVAHFRGCSGHPNRLARAYHSGDSDEIHWIVHRCRQESSAPLFVAGVSLGGNALLKWLGSRGAAALGVVDAAAAISAPMDLTAAGHALDRGFNRVYTRHFLHTLIPRALAKLEHFPGLFDAEKVRAAHSLYTFDDLVTAPLHGFAGAADYWHRASSKSDLPGIRVPTLVLNALNDPFLPASALPRMDQVSDQVHLEYPAQGGHVGFVSGPWPGHLHWLPQRLLHFFSTQNHG